MESSLRKVPKAVWIIGAASFLITSSAAMLFSVFALFLNSLGVSIKDISIIDGIVEGSGYIFKVASGIISDYLHRRSAIFALGAFCTAISRPIVLILMSFPGAVIARVLDRCGNGLQATPRDALISAYAPSDIKGTCFGIRQSLGTFGSVIGALIVMLLLFLSKDNFRLVFLAASIPALLALFLILRYVRDPQVPQAADESVQKRTPFKLAYLTRLGAPYWALMGIVGVFMLCRFSESLIILHGRNHFELSNANAIWTMLVYNLISSISAYISGRVTDRVSSFTLLLWGCGITCAANLVVIFSPTFGIFLCGVMLWGIQIGLMQNIFCAEITALVPSDLRGTGFGFFYFISAISILIANVIGGKLMMICGTYAFIYSAALSLVATAFILLVYKKRSRVRC